MWQPNLINRESITDPNFWIKALLLQFFMRRQSSIYICYKDKNKGN